MYTACWLSFQMKHENTHRCTSSCIQKYLKRWVKRRGDGLRITQIISCIHINGLVGWIKKLNVNKLDKQLPKQEPGVADDYTNIFFCSVNIFNMSWKKSNTCPHALTSLTVWSAMSTFPHAISLGLLITHLYTNFIKSMLSSKSWIIPHNCQFQPENMTSYAFHYSQLKNFVKM